jgi:hypothetical protein
MSDEQLSEALPFDNQIVSLDRLTANKKSSYGHYKIESQFTFTNNDGNHKIRISTVVNGSQFDYDSYNTDITEDRDRWAEGNKQSLTLLLNDNVDELLNFVSEL